MAKKYIKTSYTVKDIERAHPELPVSWLYSWAKTNGITKVGRSLTFTNIDLNRAIVARKTEVRPYRRRDAQGTKGHDLEKTLERDIARTEEEIVRLASHSLKVPRQATTNAFKDNTQVVEKVFATYEDWSKQYHGFKLDNHSDYPPTWIVVGLAVGFALLIAVTCISGIIVLL